MKFLKCLLYIVVILVSIPIVLLLPSLEGSAYKSYNRFKFFERGEIIEQEDGRFEVSASIGDVIQLDLIPCYIDSIIFLDVLKADSIWVTRGDTVSEVYDGNRTILLDFNNLPQEYDCIASPEMESIWQKTFPFLSTFNPSKLVWRKKSIRRFFKKERNGVEVDYAICNDSLIISIYHSVFNLSSEDGKIQRMKHINFIHKYNCHDNDWALTGINEKENYFPGLYKSDILRRCIDQDFKAYIETQYKYNKYRYCRKKKKIDEKYTLSDLYNDTYIQMGDFPVGSLSTVTDSIYRLPRGYEYLKGRYLKKLIKEPKTVICMEYKLKGDSLIVHFFNCYREKQQVRMGFNFLGYYVHTYDCRTRKWEKASESFLVF